VQLAGFDRAPGARLGGRKTLALTRTPKRESR
jgi:hypothetical protein